MCRNDKSISRAVNVSQCSSSQGICRNSEKNGLLRRIVFRTRDSQLSIDDRVSMSDIDFTSPHVSWHCAVDKNMVAGCLKIRERVYFLGQ